jgi:hypothetical protein
MMEKYFLIHLLGDPETRPPISCQVKEYFEEFILKNVLIKKKIAVGGRWQIMFTIHFQEKGAQTNFDDVAVAKSCRTVAAESVKLYESVILVDAIRSYQNPYLGTIELMYKVIKLFLTAAYKKVTFEFMDELWNRVDMNYLLSLPYPAPFSEQKYLIDEVMKRQNRE